MDMEEMKTLDRFEQRDRQWSLEHSDDLISDDDEEEEGLGEEKGRQEEEATFRSLAAGCAPSLPAQRPLTYPTLTSCARACVFHVCVRACACHEPVCMPCARVPACVFRSTEMISLIDLI